MNRTRSLLAAALALAGLSMGGCLIFTPNKPLPTTSTDEARVEFEVVTNARLVWEDTTPITMGRQAFMDGADHLLVMTRITSVNQDADNPKSPRVDRYFERVWITVPMGMAQGQELIVEEMEEKFLTSTQKE